MTGYNYNEDRVKEMIDESENKEHTRQNIDFQTYILQEMCQKTHQEIIALVTKFAIEHDLVDNVKMSEMTDIASTCIAINLLMNSKRHNKEKFLKLYEMAYEDMIKLRTE